ncbi:MAG: hypothetical protein C0582_02215 [Alphaproteobacteria bacterium]|nr:MAG: hypothetical protein C0582_02215 [Alphaproteobacteria bacterium]
MGKTRYFIFLVLLFFGAESKGENYSLCKDGNFNKAALFNGNASYSDNRYDQVNNSKAKKQLCGLNLQVPQSVDCSNKKCKPGFQTISQWVIDFVKEYKNGNYTTFDFKKAVNGTANDLYKIHVNVGRECGPTYP